MHPPGAVAKEAGYRVRKSTEAIWASTPISAAVARKLLRAPSPAVASPPIVTFVSAVPAYRPPVALCRAVIPMVFMTAILVLVVVVRES